MKAIALLLLSRPLPALSAPPTSLPSFQEKLDRLPSLSIGEAIKVGTRMTTFPPDVRDVVLGREPTSAPRPSPRHVSRMPVIAPRPEVDRHMRIKISDLTTDFNLTIIHPDVASAP